MSRRCRFEKSILLSLSGGMRRPGMGPGHKALDFSSAKNNRLSDRFFTRAGSWFDFTPRA
jgi:hypothetical protein